MECMKNKVTGFASRPKCGKRFKRESELNAQALVPQQIPQKCEHCTYTNSDPRNLRAHMRTIVTICHSNVANAAKVLNGLNNGLGIKNL